ncbi:uncharacterized protein LOC124456190 isoform X2 [Xenia sp. Carnegie-2017]|uniref:uncharacterized protein LOC124456190 isoform X2 n=1 Tax=Xenia sp. Carnegie-2017 TaxID=2897299 RepID=UPI001F04DE78|nr:uncharacterized protein LOC124456190 isoform X2 [Xenia sp. Carnegie-2017]
MFTHPVWKYFFGVFFVKFVYENGNLVRSDSCRITTTPQNYFVHAPLGSNLTLSFSYECKGNISWPENYSVQWSANGAIICWMFIDNGFLDIFPNQVDDSYMNSTFSSITLNNISIKYNRWQVLAQLTIIDKFDTRVGLRSYSSQITILVTATYTSSSLITSWIKGGMSGSLQAQNSGEPKFKSSMLPTLFLMASTIYRSESASSKRSYMLSPSSMMSSFTKAFDYNKISTTTSHVERIQSTVMVAPNQSVHFNHAFDYNKISTTTSHVERIQSTVMVAPNQSVHFNHDHYPVSDEKQRVAWTWIFICFSAVVIVIISITLLTIYSWKILLRYRHSVVCWLLY